METKVLYFALFLFDCAIKVAVIGDCYIDCLIPVETLIFHYWRRYMMKIRRRMFSKTVSRLDN